MTRLYPEPEIIFTIEPRFPRLKAAARAIRALSRRVRLGQYSRPPKRKAPRTLADCTPFQQVLIAALTQGEHGGASVRLDGATIDRRSRP